MMKKKVRMWQGLILGSFISLISLVSFISLCGCVQLNAPVKLRVNSAPELNHDSDQASLPVVLKVYQLKDEQPFKQANFEELWKKDKATLSGSLLSTQSYTIYPGKTERFQISRTKGARFLGVVATFRKPETDTWKAVSTIPGGMAAKSIYIHLQENQIRITN